MTHRFPRMLFLLLIVAIPFAAFAAEPVGRNRGGGSVMNWELSTAAGHDKATLTWSCDGEVRSLEFKSGRTVSLSVADLGTDLQNGTCTWELRLTPTVSSAVSKKLAAARNANDDKAARKILKDAGIDPDALVASGAFAIQNGSFVSTDSVEDANAAATAPRGAISNNAVSRPTGPIASLDQVIPDDLIVQGSGCFGFDCVNNESFGFDTIRLKENNLRIKAEDTSVGSFPTNDWQLTFNDSASGGQSKFSVEDITGARVPLTVEAGATTNSLYVDSTGRVGFRSSTPVLDLHVNTSNTPAIRLEQNNTGGFTAQTWDIGANEANFFVRDVTGGSLLSFRIRPGAPTSSLDISADGDVGVGTASPDYRLNVVDTGAPDDTVLQLENNGPTRMRIQNTSSGETWNVGHQSPGGTGFTLSDVGDAVSEMLLDVSGNMTIAGTLTQNSSREVKHGFESLDPAATLAAVREMPILTWVYNHDATAARHAGPTAEDFHSAFKLGVDDKHIAPSDQSGVALAAIQGLANVIEQKDQQIAELAARLAELEKKLNEK